MNRPHYYNENDPKAAQWLRNLIDAGLIHAGHVDDRSIADVRASDLDGFTQCHFFAGIGGWSYALKLAGWPEDEPVWTGSCPCQPFSAAGKRKGEADERHLWPEMHRLIAECRPATCFGEQVASDDGCRWLAGVFVDLEALEYRVAGADLCAAGAGAPHIRQRIYWLANSASSRKSVFPEAGKSTNRRQASARSGSTWKRNCWSNSESIRLATDGNRRTKPGSVCVVDGLPAGVVEAATRGFGNAIVPQVAAEFVRAFMESKATE